MEESVERAVRPAGSGSAPAAAQGRKFIAVIGINSYTTLRPLANSVPDALSVEMMFRGHLGFRRVTPLVEQAATRPAVFNLVNKKLPARLSENDTLIFYFAGHGIALPAVDGQEAGGYLATVESQDCPADCIEIADLLERIDRLPARNILVVLDACYSGSALYTPRPPAALQHNESARRCRKVIVSTRRDTTALDRGRVPEHSPFAQKLLEGLDWGRADFNTDGRVTSNELGLYIQQKVEEETGGRQKPDYAAFGSDDRGEFEIDLDRGGMSGLKVEANLALQEGQYTRLGQVVEKMTRRKALAGRPETLYFQYRHALVNNNFRTAIRSVEQLARMNLPDGACPLTQAEIEALVPQLYYWMRTLAVPEAPAAPLQVILLNGPDDAHLEPASLRERDGRLEYLTRSNSVACFRATNLSSETLHLYLLSVTDRGRLWLRAFLENEEYMVNGLPPGQSGLSYSFRIKGSQGLRENRVFISPRRIMPMLCPPSPEVLEFERLDKALLQGVETVRVWNYTWLEGRP